MKWRPPPPRPLLGMKPTPTPPIVPGFNPAQQGLLRLAYIETQTPYQRELLGAYSRAVIELARCVYELERIGASTTAAMLARYASEVTDIACEHVAMSAEIQQEPQ